MGLKPSLFQSGFQVKKGHNSCWRNIIKEVESLSKQGIHVLNYLRIKLGDESCKNITIADKVRQENPYQTFRRTPRGGVEQEQFQHVDRISRSVKLNSNNDSWTWNLEKSEGVREGLKSASIAAVASVVPTVSLGTSEEVKDLSQALLEAVLINLTYNETDIFIADLQYRLEDAIRHKVECLGDVKSLKFIDNRHNNGLVASTSNWSKNK
nr:RNA-directed DNA polymerase, eukaryota, reverse transcriptase zinc-binding domain protein [Tanacetum cinerariifolium]